MQNIEQVGTPPQAKSMYEGTNSSAQPEVNTGAGTDEQATPKPKAIETLRALAGLAAVDLIIRIKGFSYLHRIVKRWPVSRKRTENTETILRTCAAVDRACIYYFKQALCLQRSALTTCLLRRQGVAARLVIGCRVMPYHGHAWVEVNGEVVNDKKKVQEFYTVLDRL
jgi:hypothetical protein